MGKIMKRTLTVLSLILPLAACANPMTEKPTPGSAPATAVESPQAQKKDAGQRFEDRFTWNENFSCNGNAKRISLSVGGTFGSDAERMGFSEKQRAQSLDIDVFYVLPNGDQKRWFHAWGEAEFDSDTAKKSASVLLTDGNRIEFHRFGALPDPDADEGQFDTSPFFDLSINGVRFKCGMEYNPK